MMKTKIKLFCLISLFAIGNAFGQDVIFDDSWTDGTLADGADANDIPWYTSTSSQAIEVGTGFMGLVSGTSVRGIHGIFTETSLEIGDRITLTATFNTPDTVGTARSTALRFGLFNSNGAAVATDVGSSTDTVWDPVSGYMIDFDVNTGEENISIRERLDPTGTNDRFMSTTSFYEAIDMGGDMYSIFDNTTYTVEFSITRSGEDETILGASLMIGDNVISTFSTTHASGTDTTFNMVGLQSNSNTFGSSSAPDTADNGIDFTNITLVKDTVVIVADWKGYEIPESGIVDTGVWMGLVYVLEAPWVYSYDAEAWFYFPSDEAGINWAYVPR